MPRMVTIQLQTPIASAKLLGESKAGPTRENIEPEQAKLVELQKRNLIEVCQALQDALNKVSEFKENLFKRHKEQIARLSVEIARKILMQKVQEGDYKIESIIQETLENAPTRQDVVIHLNPEDLVQYQKSQESSQNSNLADIKFVSDPKVRRAECFLETPKGIVESFIDEHLERVGEALKKVE